MIGITDQGKQTLLCINLNKLGVCGMREGSPLDLFLTASPEALFLANSLNNLFPSQWLSIFYLF